MSAAGWGLDWGAVLMSVGAVAFFRVSIVGAFTLYAIELKKKKKISKARKIEKKNS